MKAVILAGGLGTRLSEETTLKPKPMVEVGGMPILWHIMKIYSSHGVNDFVICCGYKGYVIKEYFANYFLHTSDVTFDLRGNDLEVHQTASEPWRITLVDTGENSGTGGRLKLVRDHVSDGTFCFTYGDGVANVDIRAAIATHQAEGRLATLTAVQPPSRYGVLDLQGNAVKAFVEKPADGGWINGGFFVLEPGAIDYVPEATSNWEHGPMQALAGDGQLSAYYHDGFWQPMDTLRERNLLEQLWASGDAPWKVW